MKKIAFLILVSGILLSTGCNADFGPFETLLNTCVFAGNCNGGF